MSTKKVHQIEDYLNKFGNSKKHSAQSLLNLYGYSQENNLKNNSIEPKELNIEQEINTAKNDVIETSVATENTELGNLVQAIEEPSIESALVTKDIEISVNKTVDNHKQKNQIQINKKKSVVKNISFSTLDYFQGHEKTIIFYLFNHCEASGITREIFLSKMADEISINYEVLKVVIKRMLKKEIIYSFLSRRGKHSLVKYKINKELFVLLKNYNN